MLIPGEAREEIRRTRLCDRAEVGDRLVARHADAVVPNRDRALLGVVVDPDPQLGLIAVERGIRQREKTQLVVRIRRVRNEFAQEDFAVTVERVDHELQKLTNLGLETVFLGGGIFGGRSFGGHDFTIR